MRVEGADTVKEGNRKGQRLRGCLQAHLGTCDEPCRCARKSLDEQDRPRSPLRETVTRRILRTHEARIPSRPMPTATTPRSASKTAKKKSNGASRALPAALAARATAAVSAKTSRLRREAHALLALISRRKREITEAFYDIGEALTKLKERDTISALGRRSFAEVCEKDAGISVSVAERLVEIVRSLTREQALAMGQKKAMAMVTLAAATPEDDTAAGLYRKKSIALPGGKRVSPRSASANAIEEAATAIRHRRSASGSGAPARGRTTTAEERTFAALLEKRLHQLGLDRARVIAVATKPGQGSDLRFEHIPVAQIDALKKAIGR